MPMPVMNVRIVGMAVRQQRMRMLVRVGFLPIPRKIVRVLVMGVMDVSVRMRHGVMRMQVFMALRQMQPYACRHECGGGPE